MPRRIGILRGGDGNKKGVRGRGECQHLSTKNRDAHDLETGKVNFYLKGETVCANYSIVRGGDRGISLPR